MITATCTNERERTGTETAASSTMTTTTTTTTTWPDAAPLAGEELIFSISCGNSHLHWATHFGQDQDYNPDMFWRTPHIKEEDLVDEDIAAVLSRNLPDDPHDYIFGKTDDATTAAAETQSTKRIAPLISVYVVSTNQVQQALLERMWKAVPSRFFVIGGDAFFTKEEGRYDTMGTDRLATLTGAVHLYGHPALVFDGGTAMTYSATDIGGKIMGGGIGPGIQSKFSSLARDTDALPRISSDQILARVKEAQEKGHPIPTFARSTHEAMMADAFQEFALKGRNVVKNWLDKAYKQSDESASSDMKINTERRVLCTGGDGDILMQLLQPHYGGVIEQVEISSTEANDGSLSAQYSVESSKHLIHYGIACVLLNQVSLLLGRENTSSSSNSAQPHNEYVGKRVAKHFDVEADDGDNIFRGTVIQAVVNESSEPDYRIQYDDGDSEDVAADELVELFKMFEQYGEKASKRSAAPKSNKGQSGKKRENPNSHLDVPKLKEPRPRAPDTKNLSSAKQANDATKVEENTMQSTDKNATNSSSGVKNYVTKKVTKGSDIVALVNSSDPYSFVHKRISKDFDGATFFGTITKYDESDDPAFWNVLYDDGDAEDYNKKDLIKALKHYGINGKFDSHKN